MRNGVRALVGLSVLALAAGCSRGDDTAAAPPTYVPQPTDSPEAAAALDSNSTPVCPAARGEGTVSPAVSIYSITFVVNGLEQVVRDGDTLQALPGDDVQVREAVICTGPFSGDGGEACVDVAPADQDGQEIAAEHAGTHLVPVTPGLMSISGPDYTWTIDENWAHFAVVLNHWPPGATEDSGCANGRCERDDRITVAFP